MDKEYIREKYLPAMRDPSQLQCFGYLHNDATGACCAIGVYYLTRDRDWLFNRSYTPPNFPSALETFGIYLEQKIISWNDDNHLTLPEIADKVEAYIGAQDV